MELSMFEMNCWGSIKLCKLAYCFYFFTKWSLFEPAMNWSSGTVLNFEGSMKLYKFKKFFITYKKEITQLGNGNIFSILAKKESKTFSRM